MEIIQVGETRKQRRARRQETKRTAEIISSLLLRAKSYSVTIDCDRPNPDVHFNQELSGNVLVRIDLRDVELP